MKSLAAHNLDKSPTAIHVNYRAIITFKNQTLKLPKVSLNGGGGVGGVTGHD